MQLIFSIAIPLKAVPKGRPRATRAGRMYTPAKTREFERTIAAYLKAYYRQKPQAGPVRLVMDFMFQRPKRPARAYPSVGDLDNFSKAVSDAANQILFEDDTQVVELSASKSYADQDGISLALWGDPLEDNSRGL
jgi:crossover junction endodeoxyribonuclease RusA